jgi:exosortase O
MHADVRSTPLHWRGVASTGLLVTAWLFANLSSLQWLYQSFSSASSTNLLLVGFALAALLVQFVRTRQTLQISTTPQLRPYPVGLMLGSASLGLALSWLIDIPQISVLFFTLGTYGLGGLFLAPHQWRQGLPLATLIACILPFSVQFGSGLGFPVRVLTARAVEQLLAPWQVSAISSHDIIVLENGIAHVDLPCSGLKSLWTGTLFLLAATWVERHQVGMRWLLVWMASLLFLIWANTLRVLLLVLVTHVWQQPQIAEVLLVPLGLLGFIGACGLTWLLLQTVPKPNRKDRIPRVFTTAKVPSFQFTGLLAAVIAIAILAQFRPLSAPPSTIAPFQWSDAIVTESLPLTATERRFFDQSASASAQKQRFRSGNLSGSMLLVASTAWHAHHPPELCFVGNGFKVDSMEKKPLGSKVVTRWLSLQNGTLSATYWFQSPKGTTDGFLPRLWDYVIHKNTTWVMVSILFDRNRDPNSPEIQAFATDIHDAIDRSLNGG